MKEYLCVARDFVINREGQDAEVSEWLNKKAADGWRLVSVVGFVYFFEREREVSEEQVEMNCRVEFRCDKCLVVYGFNDDSPFFFGVEPGSTMLSLSHPCPRCRSAGVTVMSVSTHVENVDTDWPEVIE